MLIRKIKKGKKKIIIMIKKEKKIKRIVIITLREIHYTIL